MNDRSFGRTLRKQLAPVPRRRVMAKVKCEHDQPSSVQSSLQSALLLTLTAFTSVA